MEWIVASHDVFFLANQHVEGCGHEGLGQGCNAEEGIVIGLALRFHVDDAGIVFEY